MTILESLKEKAIKPLEEAYSLPFSAYIDDEVYEKEVEKIFHNEWVFVCQVPELALAGDYYATSIAGEPIYVMRGADGELRAFSNICRHRGTVLLDEGFGNVTRYVTCPYHAWAYSLDGELKAVPYNKLIAVDREQHRLISFHVDSWCGLVFVHLGDNPQSLQDRFAGMFDCVSQFEPEKFTAASSGQIEVWQANWKLALENAMESYHLFKVHEPTLEKVSPTREAFYLAGHS